jgi:glutamyl-tRNA reductase
VATDSPEPVIRRKHLQGLGNKLIIDLSIPSNVEKEAGDIPGITLVNVDELSRIKDENLSRREAEVPKALAIIDSYIASFRSWVQMRRHVPVLKAVKTKLKEIQASPQPEYIRKGLNIHADADEKIQQVINTMAVRMRNHHLHGCYYIQAINEFIS